MCGGKLHGADCVSQESEDRPGALSFWMANASELLHFVKHDRQLQGAPHMMEAQDSLAEAVQLAFSHLVDCLQEELANAMPAFLEESLRDLDADDGKIRILTTCFTTKLCLFFIV